MTPSHAKIIMPHWDLNKALVFKLCICTVCIMYIVICAYYNILVHYTRRYAICTVKTIEYRVYLY